MTNPLVSVIIPAYNAEDFLEEAIESIVSQTYKNIEILIINDASKDNTLQIANVAASRDDRIRVINNTYNIGIGGNRSLGIQQAKGEYICWQDADDISLPARIDSQVRYLQAHPQVGIVGGFIIFFTGNTDLYTRRYAENDSLLRKTMFRYTSVAQPAAMAPKAVYDKVGVYNSQLVVAEDLEMLFRIGEHYKFANIQEPVIRYRQTESSLTATKLRQMEDVTLKLRTKYAHSPAYTFSIGDRIYNTVQKASRVLPSRIRRAVFRRIRGDA